MIDTVKWGIIGPGIIAHQFAKDIEFVENAELLAVASNTAGKAEHFARQYSIPNYYTGYDDLFENPDIDAIYIATTHNFHKQNCIDAIDAGKAVLCEKPLTDNLADARELVAYARSKEAYLMEAMWTYFLPSINQALEWIDEGRIGEVVNVKANFGYPKKFDPKHRLFNPELSGGCLLDMGIYPVAMAWLFIQSLPSEYRQVVQKAPTGVDYDVNMQWVYPDSRVANLHSSFKVKLNNHTYIFGEKGYIDIPDFWRSHDCYLYEGDKIVDKFNDEREGLGFEFEIAAASEDILAGRQQNEIMPHATSIKLQELMNAVMQQF